MFNLKKIKKFVGILIALAILPFSANAQITVPQGGTGTTTLPAGQLLYGSTTIRISSSASLFWDYINNRLGIGSTTPGSQLSLGTVGGINIYPNATSTWGSAANGINLISGCFAIRGLCISGSSGGSSASTTLLADNNTWTGLNNFKATSTMSALQVGSTAIGSNVLKVTPLTGLTVSSSESTGGVFLCTVGAVDSMCGVFHSNHAGSSRTVSIVAENASYTGNALHVRSNGTATAFNVAGHPNGQGIIKVAADGAGDANASLLSLDASTGSFLGQTFFFKCGISSTCWNMRDVNNSQVLTADAFGNFGWGTTTPAWQVQIATSSKPQLALTDSTAGVDQKHWTFRSVGGNLYVATSTDTLATTTISALEIAGGGFGTTTLRGLNIAGFATTTSNVGFNITSGCYAKNGTCISGSGGSGSGTVGAGTTGQLPYYAANGTTLTATSSLFLSTSGAIGIGTVNPSEVNVNSHLTVAGPGAQDLIASTTDNTTLSTAIVEAYAPGARIFMGAHGTNQVTTQYGITVGGYGEIGAINSSSGTLNGLLIGTRTTATPIIFGTNSTEKVRISGTNSNVGLASTSPFAQLSVNPDGIGSNTFEMAVGSSTATHFAITGGGMVGAGTSTPSYPLGAQSGTSSFGFRDEGGNAAVARIQGTAFAEFRERVGTVDFRMGSNTTMGYMQVFSAHPWAVFTGNTERMRLLNTNGNLGIATTVPFTKLAVVGTFSVNGLSSATGKNSVCIDTVTKEIVDAGNTTCTLSSIYLKDLTGEVTPEVAKYIVEKMKAITFKYKGQKVEEHYGFIAEDVAKIDKEVKEKFGVTAQLAQYTREEYTDKTTGHVFKKGDPNGVDYEMYTAVLTVYLQSQTPKESKQTPYYIFFGIAFLGYIIYNESRRK